MKFKINEKPYENIAFHNLGQDQPGSQPSKSSNNQNENMFLRNGGRSSRTISFEIIENFTESCSLHHVEAASSGLKPSLGGVREA